MLPQALVLATVLTGILAGPVAEEPLQVDVRWRSFQPYGSWQLKKASNESSLSNILSDCSKSSDSVKILGISVTPDPPEKGQEVTADVILEFTEEVEGGSLNILVKYRNFFPIMNKKKNLCNIPSILEDPCPLSAGVHEATLVHKVSSYTPSGTYTGKVVGKDKSGNELMCIRINFTL